MFYRSLALIVALCSLSLSTYAQDVKSDVQSYLFNGGKLPYEHIRNEDTAHEVISIVKGHQNNPEFTVRRKSYSLALRIGLRCEAPSVKSEVLDILINATVDEEHSIRESFHHAFSLFPKSLFSQEFRERVTTYLQKDEYANITHILLAGFLDLRVNEERLKELVGRDDDHAFKRQVFYTSAFRSISFSSHMALARMGDEKSISLTMEAFKSADEKEVVIHYLGLIAYLKQPESLEYFVSLLDSDKFIGGGDVFRESYGGRGLKYLIPMVEGIPIKENRAGLYGMNQVEEAKEFIVSNRENLKINKDVW